MQVTKGTWRMCEQCVPGSLSSSPTQEPGNEANHCHTAKTTGSWVGPGKRGYNLLKGLGDHGTRFAHSIVVAFLVIQQSSFTCLLMLGDLEFILIP